MDEEAARGVLLVKAIETADQARAVLSEDDRRYASRSARELALWDAAGKQQPLTPDLFLHKRSQQILARLCERKPGAAVFLKARPWRRWAALAAPVLAFLFGVMVDRIGDAHHVDLLSAPLLLMLLWNLAVYASLVAWPLLPRPARPAWPGLALPQRRPPQWLAASLLRFHAEWLTLSAPLETARLKRVLHLSAALLALGAVASLYLRGLLSQYQVGWESTFLDAVQVHWLLSALFAPANWLLRLPGFTLEQVRALQFPQAAATSGALWVHLYAGTLVLLVVVPRLLLAALAWRRERRLSRVFPIDLGQPYFTRLCAGLTPATAATLHVRPYGYRVGERQREGLGTLARMLLGEQAALAISDATAYGEDAPAPTAPPGAMTAALFPLSATPEQENHGAFLDRLRSASTGGVIGLVDASGYLERLGPQAAGRADERAELWRRFCAQHKVPVAIVDLREPQRHAEEIEALPGAGAAAQ